MIARFACVAAGLFAISCGRAPHEAAETPAGAVVAVEARNVATMDMPVRVVATGATDALHKESIVAPVAGWVISLKALEGAAVARGELLAVIRPKDAQAAISGAEAMLRAARTDAERAAAKRAAAIAESTQHNVDVVAAIDGAVSVRSVAAGEIVAEGAAMFTLVDLTSLIFSADVPLKDLPSVRVGMRAAIRFPQWPGREWTGIIDAVSPQADGSSQTVKMRLRIESRSAAERALLRSGMSGTAEIVTGMHPRALVVPRTALLRNGETDRYSVMVVGADSLARTAAVSVGLMSDSTAEIVGGLSAGALVITRGGYSLADSTRVTTGGGSKGNEK
jgi:multidrug efflux pump subunit AcrA (membrane-fusion protein)